MVRFRDDLHETWKRVGYRTEKTAGQHSNPRPPVCELAGEIKTAERVIAEVRRQKKTEVILRQLEKAKRGAVTRSELEEKTSFGTRHYFKYGLNSRKNFP